MVWRLQSPLGVSTDPLLTEVASRYRQRRFDLLGSGWVAVEAAQKPDTLCWPADRAAVADLLGLISDPAYGFIDWAVDFKSGYRWSTRVMGPASPYGHRVGVDIKVPWELARGRHLLALAQAFEVTGDADLAQDIRNQILDFAAANPPGWGVNWACAMDVAIRIATFVVAVDLIRVAGFVPDGPFERVLADQTLAHGRFIFGHLENGSPHRGNHYLADLCGLIFAALYVPDGAETQRWRDFALPELDREIVRQFTPDGANFEASTAYHRLSAEMAIQTVALVTGAGGYRFSAAALARLKGAVHFALAVTKPSGRAVQIGDNDSGRFLGPALLAGPDLVFRHLDFRPLVAAGAELFGLLGPDDADVRVEAALIRAFTGGQALSVPPPPEPVPMVHAPPQGTATAVVRVHLPWTGDAFDCLAFPDFGLFIWKGADAFLSLRCGPIGQAGNGGHSHNDQLAVELELGGTAWAQDPGTGVYTADFALRDRYRSVLAHFAPRFGDREPARLLLPFRLEDRAHSRLVAFGPDEMAGYHSGFGTPVLRRVRRNGAGVVVEDYWGGAEIGPNTRVTELRPATSADLATLWGLTVPFSPGYGIIPAP